ncbi:MAG TPA: hypothetical protein VIG39_10955 [Rhizomicrobium sp.]
MTLRNIVLAAAVFLSANVPAWSAGDNVVLIDVGKVDRPSHLPGLCQVNGTVAKVWEGKGFRRGQFIALKVPCSAGNSYMTPVEATPRRDPRFVDANVLIKSKQGIAHLDDTGALIWQRTRGPSDGMADTSGYRVLDGALLPAVPDHVKS